MSDKLLREYVSFIISESEYGGFDVTSGADGPWGANFGSGKDLYNVFVKPFTDVVDTTVGKTKELSQRAQTLGKVAFEALATSLIPTLADDFESIFDQEKQQLDKLKAQYKDVYDATWTAFKDNDVVTAAFLYSPASVITAKVAQQAPIQTVKLLNTLTGGRLDGFLKKVVDRFKLGDTKKPLDRDSGPGLPEGKITELHKKPKQSIGNVLSQKKIQQAIKNDPKSAQMSDSARQIIDNATMQVLQRARGVVAAKSVADIQKQVGKKIKGVDELAQLPAEERQKLERVLLQGLRKSALSMYIKGIEGQIQQAIKGGISEDHPFILMLNGALSKLKSAS